MFETRIGDPGFESKSDNLKMAFKKLKHWEGLSSIDLAPSLAGDFFFKISFLSVEHETRTSIRFEKKGKKECWKKSSEQFVVPPFLRQHYVSFKNGLSGDRVVRTVASRLVGGRFDSNNCFFNSSLVGGNALKIKMKSWLCCLRVNRAKFRVIL